MTPGIGDQHPGGVGMSVFLSIGEIPTGILGDGMADVVIPMSFPMQDIMPRILRGDIITIRHIITTTRLNMPRDLSTEGLRSLHVPLPEEVEVEVLAPGRKSLRPTHVAPEAWRPPPALEYRVENPVESSGEG
jgi:hypothetical protein